MGPCFCESHHFVPNGICPVRDFWPSAPGATPREFVMPSLQGSNLNRIPNALLAKLDVEDAVRYMTHCFRLVAAMELLNMGATLAVIVETDGWNSAAAYRA